MGITLESENKSIDLGYIGFNNLRTKVAELTNEDIYKHYKDFTKATCILGEDERERFFKEYDAKIKEIDKKYEYKYNPILYFLYSNDCGATVDYEICQEIYKVIKNYDDDIAYGYAGRDDCATFKDFKELVKDCIDNKCDMEWW